MKKAINDFRMNIPAKSVNEGFIRAVSASFSALADPNIEEINDIKTAVSEAVTNAVVHGYKEKQGRIYIEAVLYDDKTLKIRIRDKGCGIADVKKAMEPLFTTAGDERSGLGFSVMESFTDKVSVRSAPSKGTVVTLIKKISGKCE